MKSLEALRILSECANGEKKLIFSDSLNLESIIKKDLERLEKLEKAIKILKDEFYLRVHSNMFGSWLFIKEKIKCGEVVSCALDLDIVDTIKEVFGNDDK